MADLLSGQLEGRKSILPSMGLEVLVCIDEEERSELGEKVKDIISTYERALYYRWAKKEKKPPIDIYSQIVKDLKINLPFDQYKEVVERLVDEIVVMLKNDPFLHTRHYQYSPDVTAWKNVYAFVRLLLTEG